MLFREIYNSDFIKENYSIILPSTEDLQPYIDFFWESDYDSKLSSFTVQTFPRIGSALLFNIEGMFNFTKGKTSFLNNDHIFYLRNTIIETTHQPNSKIFGVQFRVNLPLIMSNRKVIARNEIFESSQLVSKKIIAKIFAASSFEERIKIAENYFLEQITGKMEYRANIINQFLEKSMGDIAQTILQKNKVDIPCTQKTLERYFTEYMGITPHKAIMICNARNALSRKISAGKPFNYTLNGYYDFSHYTKSIKKFKAGYKVSV